MKKFTSHFEIYRIVRQCEPFEIVTLRTSAAEMSVDNEGLTVHFLERENQALKAQVAELERLVMRDTLTPVFNRRRFMDELARWCWRKHRQGGEYGLLFIDVDNLKAVNDGYGHLAGDAILITIANGLLASVQRSDLVARIGGDEFAVLLDNIPAPQIYGKVRSITKAIGKLEIQFEGACLKPAISIGFTTVEADIEPVELLLRADRSMYAAKEIKAMQQRSRGVHAIRHYRWER